MFSSRSPIGLLVSVLLLILLATALCLTPSSSASSPPGSGAGSAGLSVSAAATPSLASSANTGHHFTQIALSPAFSTDGTLFAGTDGGLFRSTDGGAAWYSVGPRQGVTALSVSPNYAVDRTIFVAFDGDGIYRSTDAGLTWVKKSEGLGDPFILDIDFAPDFAATQTVFAIARSAGVRKTIDAGEVWFAKNTGLPYGQRVTVHVISPQFQTDKVQFVGTVETGIYKTEGSAWFSVNYSIPMYWIRPVRDLAISPCYATDGTVFAALGGRLFKTGNGGVHWYPMTPEGYSGYIVRLSPAYCTDHTAFAEINGRLFKSTWYGVEWWDTQGSVTGTVSAVGLSPAYGTDQTLFAAFGDGMYKSTDGGRSWAYSFSSVDPTPIPSATPTSTATSTFTPTPTPSLTSTPSPTPTPSLTPTPSATSTFTPTPTASPTPTATPHPCADAYEPDDDWSEAKPITTEGVVQSRTFHTAGDVDYAKFVGVSGSRYEMWTTSLGGGILNDTVLTLYGTDGITMLAYNDDDPSAPPASRLEWLCPATGTYYLKAAQLNPTIGGCEFTYALGVRIAPPIVRRAFLPVVMR